jgi:retron-type reverse transcriptase
MKTYRQLFEQICAFPNLLGAAHKAQRGKRLRDPVARFNFGLEQELLTLQEELLGQTYTPGRYKAFYICEPKRRLISAAPYRDRVVHHALCNVIEPLFDRTFIYDSYACRKEKGTHAAVDRFTQFCRKNRYVLKADIARYFPSIDHEVADRA